MYSGNASKRGMWEKDKEIRKKYKLSNSKLLLAFFNLRFV